MPLSGAFVCSDFAPFASFGGDISVITKNSKLHESIRFLPFSRPKIATSNVDLRTPWRAALSNPGLILPSALPQQTLMSPTTWNV